MENVVSIIEFNKFSLQKKIRILGNKLKSDEYTYRHSVNVANYCVSLLKVTGYDINEEVMYYAGLFHDIGKIKVDATILNKPCGLNDEEFSLMKKHTVYGRDILLQYDFPEEILIGAQLHHEKFDGTGYPLGLKGEEIPLIPRIISICDVFDALTSDRPYRKAFSFAEALDVMINQHNDFDPQLKKIFFSHAANIVFPPRVITH